MKLVVIPDAIHGGEVHSVDIDRLNEKVLTAGKDGTVAVYSLRAVQSAQALEPLSTFAYHDGPVVIAKWSPASDSFISCDKVGNVYLNDGEPRKLYPFPALKEGSVNIIDGCWSPKGNLFAWSTADGKIHVVDVLRNTYQELTSIVGEKEKATLGDKDKPLVQRSLAFDPTLYFLVSLGDDTLINMFQYQEENGLYQFRLISRISKLINKTPLTVKYKRISWLPDGEFVLIPTASKNQTSLISLISRSQNWSNKVSLVGHDLNCEVVRFNPKIYTTTPDAGPDADLNVYNVIASAGSDRSLVVWNSSKDSPVFVVRDVVSSPIVDLTWDKSGSCLVMASLEGKLVTVTFEPEELGTPVAPDFLKKLTEVGEATINPFDHRYEHETTKRGSSLQIEILNQKNATSITAPPKQERAPQQPQQETPKEDTKQEVSLLGPIEPEIPDATAPAEDDILTSSMKRAKPKPRASPRPTRAPLKQETQKVTTKNGKKRIQPVLISTSEPLASLKPEPLGTSTAAAPSRSLMEFDKPSYFVSEDVLKERKRLKGPDDTTAKKFKRDLEPVKFVGLVIVNPTVAFSKVRLLVPKVRLNFRVVSSTDGDSSLDIRNGQGNESAPSRITFFKKDKQVWCDFIPRFVQLVVEGHEFWALSTSDGQIFTYSHVSGRRLLPPLVLGAPLSFLESHHNFLMAVTSVGELYVWDIAQRKLHLQLPLSLGPLLDISNKFQKDGLSKSDNITMCSITSLGIPLVTLSNGSGYLYNKDLGSWQTITESWWAFGSHYWNSLSEDSHPLVPGENSSLVGLLEHKTNEEILRKTRTGRSKYMNKISKNMIMKEGFENLENTISLSHLENRVLCAELLGENADFKRFLIIYAKRVCELGLKAKLFDICSQLLGPDPDDDSDKSAWLPQICGIDKHLLLKEIVLACADNRDAQRILIHFGKRVGILEDEDKY